MPPQTQMIDRRESSVRKLIAELFDATDKAVKDALQCVKDHDMQLAQTIIDDDAVINALHHSIEGECVAVIARMQPMAGDLRELLSDIQIAAELERIADYACSMVNNVQQMKQPATTEITDAVLELGGSCRTMLGIVRQAYETRDIQLARDAAAMDNEVDEGEQDIIKQVFAWQKEHPDDFMISTHALWITHSMERIGDRVTNIAERVIYIATSKTEKLN